MTLGSRIRARRKSRHLTQAEVAQAAKIERSHLTRIEGGQWIPRIETLDKIAKALGTTSSALLANGVRRRAA